MKAKAIVATLLVAAGVHADARFVSPYPRKPLAPDESGGWIVTNRNAWSDSAESESDRRRTVAKKAGKRPQDWRIFFCIADISPLNGIAVGFVTISLLLQANDGKTY